LVDMIGTQIGDISETKVQLKLLQKGFPVVKPISNWLPYDLGVEINGKILKVQVKTAHRSGRCYKTNLKNSRGKLVRLDTVDFFAFVIKGTEIIYVIPANELAGRSSLYFSPKGKRRTDKYSVEQYKNSWELLNAA
jgi:hypothetical protein